MRVARLLPVQIEIGDETGRQDKVDGAASGDLISDMDGAALGVARIGALHVTHSIELMEL